MITVTIDCEVVTFIMLLKCCVILITFFKSVSCDDLKPESTTANIKKFLDHMNNPLINRVQLTNNTRRYLNEYNVVTNDGYILTVFRLTTESTKVHADKDPVLLVHGLFQSSDKFLQQSENQSLAFRLQDSGFDVWLANVRGNKYGRKHIYFGPETKGTDFFFNYTYEEIALNDIAATVDFIIDETKREKIHYIGYSLGGTIFLVLNSMEPTYNDRFNTAHLLAPIGYQNFFPNNDLQIQASRCGEIYEQLLNVSTVEIFPYESTNKDKLFSIEECLGNKTYENVCHLLKLNETMGIKIQGNKINETRGGSIKELVHLAQNVKSKSFSRWDYGEQKNEEHYGTKEPATYNLNIITVASTIFFTLHDEYVSPKDIADMAADMTNAITREVKRKNMFDIATRLSQSTARNVGKKDIAAVTNKGNVSTVQVVRKDVMATAVGRSATVEEGIKDIADVAPDKGNASIIQVERKYVVNTVVDNTATGEMETENFGNMTTDRVNASIILLKKKGIADRDTYISNERRRDVEKTNIHDINTDIVDDSVNNYITEKHTGLRTKEAGGAYFKHNDFTDAPDVMELVYNDIVIALEKISNQDTPIGRTKNILNDENDKKKTDETDEEVLNKQIKNTNWVLDIIAPCIIFIIVLIFMCLIKSVTYSCHMEW